MAIAETLTEGFVKELIAYAMASRTVFEVVLQNMKFQYLQTEAEKTVWKALTKYNAKYKKQPTYGLLEQMCAESEDALILIDEISTLPTDLGQYELLEQFQEYLRQMMFLDANERIVETFNRGNKNDSYELFMQMADRMQNFSIMSSRFERVFGDFEERNKRRQLGDDGRRFRVPTGIDELDYSLGGLLGGPESGEACLILADSGVGKSQALIHIGLTASRLDHVVAHFQLEGTADQCLNRYDAAWTGILQSEIKTGNIDKNRFKALERIIAKQSKHDVHVMAQEEYGGKTVADMRRDLKDLVRSQGRVDVIIVDYLELLSTGDGINYTPESERHRQTKIARALKELAMEFNAVLWTATQSNNVPRENRNDPKFVITRDNLSEDKGKIRPFDIFITLNQTDDERTDNVIRIWRDKIRDHKNPGKPIFIATNYDHARFYDRMRTANLEENL